ncbi:MULTISPECIES: SDR family NAD(P)-dependent oxidoreductase [Streptomyces]|uniref:SDR family NAD(P)-dependent oxidoreductase n=1 Tax=Streptomyces lycii TaxID=2654337 RepID=A0ABQ7FIS1_9ACTN|nr:SDR family NAD(P)-dependent oxidoreductase [Streptomyces lycii]KAF4408879.1 SDR family NAD(P)-dependent oxidoreductase [Streptomyces lycii]
MPLRQRTTEDPAPPSPAAPEGGPATPPDLPVALVTGASSGIGTAVAERLAADGGRAVLLSGRDEARLAAVAASTGGTALPADLATAEGCRDLARRAVGRAGRVDVLVAGAGLGWAGRFDVMPAADLDHLVTVNLTSTLRLVHALLPGMVRRGGGHVVLVASVAGAVGVRGEAVYSATKGAVRTFADALRQEVRGDGVAVSVVLPGAVDTPFFDRRGTPYRRSFPRAVPPERVADAVCRALARGRREVYVPGWLSVPARIRGAAPGLYDRLAARFG